MSILETARRAKELDEKATPGPWGNEAEGDGRLIDRDEVWARPNDHPLIGDDGAFDEAALAAYYNSGGGIVARCERTEDEQSEADAAFISFSRSALPELAEAVEELVVGLRKAEKALLWGTAGDDHPCDIGCSGVETICPAHQALRDVRSLLARITEGDET